MTAALRVNLLRGPQRRRLERDTLAARAAARPPLRVVAAHVCTASRAAGDDEDELGGPEDEEGARARSGEHGGPVGRYAESVAPRAGRPEARGLLVVAAKKPKRKASTRTPDRQKPTVERMRAYAIQVFEDSARVRWTAEIEATFKGLIAGEDPERWNADRRAAQALLAALDKALAHARSTEGDEKEDTRLRAWLRDEAAEPTGPIMPRGCYAHSIWHLRFWLESMMPHEHRRDSAHVRVVRFLNVSNFLNLGRPPKTDELIAASILCAGVTESELEKPTVSEAWAVHWQRIHNATKAHPKGPPSFANDDERARWEALRAHVRPIVWPRTVPV